MAGRPHLDVVGPEALARDLEPALLVERPAHVGPVDRGQRPLDLVDPRAQPGTEGAEVGNDRP